MEAQRRIAKQRASVPRQSGSSWHLLSEGGVRGRGQLSLGQGQHTRRMVVGDCKPGTTLPRELRLARVADVDPHRIGNHLVDGLRLAIVRCGARRSIPQFLVVSFEAESNSEEARRQQVAQQGAAHIG